jgi:hypothetical protein
MLRKYRRPLGILQNANYSEENLKICEILGSHASNMNMTAIWDIAPCSLVEVVQHFRGAYCLHHQGDDDELLQDYMWCYIPEGRHLHLKICLEDIRTGAKLAKGCSSTVSDFTKYN